MGGIMDFLFKFWLGAVPVFFAFWVIKRNIFD